MTTSSSSSAPEIDLRALLGGNGHTLQLNIVSDNMKAPVMPSRRSFCQNQRCILEGSLTPLTCCDSNSSSESSSSNDGSDISNDACYCLLLSHQEDSLSLLPDTPSTLSSWTPSSAPLTPPMLCEKKTPTFDRWAPYSTQKPKSANKSKKSGKKSLHQNKQETQLLSLNHLMRTSSKASSLSSSSSANSSPSSARARAPTPTRTTTPSSPPCLSPRRPQRRGSFGNHQQQQQHTLELLAQALQQHATILAEYNFHDDDNDDDGTEEDNNNNSSSSSESLFL